MSDRSTTRNEAVLQQPVSRRGVIKSMVFGFVISWVAVFLGYDDRPTPAGVGRATTMTVVSSSLAVLGLDFILTSLMF